MNKQVEVIVMSDNHGNRDCLEYIKDKHKNADYFFHCGDAVLPPYLLDGFAIVQGNNDPYGAFPDQRICEIGNHHILLIHGHKYMVYGSMDHIIAKAKSLQCDMVCFGHTHIYFNEVIHGIHLLNPGCIIRNRDGSGGSYMRIVFEGDKVRVERMSYGTLR